MILGCDHVGRVQRGCTSLVRFLDYDKAWQSRFGSQRGDRCSGLWAVMMADHVEEGNTIEDAPWRGISGFMVSSRRWPATMA
ncbi:unnamed protein product [Lupinus luteus]|uniref:Uncharacterized protein n=1 Tax=Lupinus luteus TaxID=3873 RepID=A0AAV1WBR4_LUPLU